MDIEEVCGGCEVSVSTEPVLFEVLVGAWPYKWETYSDLPTAKYTALWGTYGKGGAEHCGGGCMHHRLRYVRLMDCDTEHLLAILATQHQLADTCYPAIIISILADRGVCPIVV
jgi:hypothetical protein